MDIKLYEHLFTFCKAAYIENEKRIVRQRLRKKQEPIDLLKYRKFFSTEKWTVMQDSFLYKAFISKELEDNLLLEYKDRNTIQSISVMHKLTDKIVCCDLYFSLKKPSFLTSFKAHEAWMRDKKAKLLIYLFEEDYNVELIEKYLKRKQTSKSLRRLKRYEKKFNLDGNVVNIFYLKIAKKETFMTLMKDLL